VGVTASDSRLFVEAVRLPTTAEALPVLQPAGSALAAYWVLCRPYSLALAGAPCRGRPQSPPGRPGYRRFGWRLCENVEP